MNLQQHTYKILVETELIPAVKDEWEKMYHNASLTHCKVWPDYDGYEDEFWEGWLYHEREQFINDLEEAIRNQWGFDWNIYQWGRSGGRSGATIAPDGFANENLGHLSKNIDIDMIVDFYNCFEGDEDWKEGYEILETHLAAFKFINESVAGALKYLNDNWEAYKSDHLLEDAA